MRAALATSAACLILTLAPGLAQSALAADTWSTVEPGVELLARTVTTTPRQRIHAAFVDVCKDGMHARATKYDERKKRTSAWAQSVGAIVAVNGAFFEYTNYNASGWSIGDGETWPTANNPTTYTAIAFASHGRATIFQPSDPFPPPSYWREAVPGNPLLLDDGAVVHEACYSHFCNREPRTAVGLTADGKKAILVTVDGRATNASGMTRLELAALMKDLGAYRAMNLDGGGSTTMYVKGRGVVNSPSDGSERVVASHLGFTTVAGERGCCSYEPVSGASGVFGDLADSSWAKPYAEALFTAGVTSGCQQSPRLYCPDCVLTRGNLAVFIAKGLGLAPVTPVTFNDIPAGASYGPYAEALRVAGITSGCGGGGYCPDRYATRYEAAAFIARGMGLPTGTSTGMFTDVTAAQAGAVEALANACVVSGCGASTFCPDEEITRAQLGKMVAVGFSLGGFGPCISTGSGSGGGLPGAGGAGAGGAGGAGGAIGAGGAPGGSNSDTGGAGGAAGVPGGGRGGEDAINPVKTDDASDPGCGCTTAPAPARGGLWVALAACASLLRRRKRA